MEITAANELDVVILNAELAAAHGFALYRLFDRSRHYLSEAAWQAWQAQFAANDSWTASYRG
ncbi:hypothetical protein [Nocardia terrae]|uniref:hypothetical protein n=1 Tax=Nocardia terrae TaxID=2675851 RepID=UPI0018DF9D17|nr:hypothetical protein [Nocardia terrae]